VGDITPGMSPIVLSGREQTVKAENMLWGMENKGSLIIGENDIDDWIYESGKTDEFLRDTMPQLRSWQDYEQLSFA